MGVHGKGVGVKTQQPDGAHAHGNTARRVVDNRNVEGCGQQRPKNDPRHNHHNPQYANHWAPLTRKRHQQEHRPQRLTERSDPTEHATERTGDCPGPPKETGMLHTGGGGVRATGKRVGVHGSLVNEESDALQMGLCGRGLYRGPDSNFFLLLLHHHLHQKRGQ